MLVSRHSQSWHLLLSSTKLEVMAVISSRLNDKDMAWRVERESLMLSWWLFAFRLSVGEVKKNKAKKKTARAVNLIWGSETDNVFLGFESIPALSVVCVQEFSPLGAADVSSNNESEHIAKVHLGGGCTPMSPLISNGVSNSECRLIEGLRNVCGYMLYWWVVPDTLIYWLL